MSNKKKLINSILDSLETALKNAVYAAETARSDAIDDQSVAETQYDTLGIEASYLAQGQSERVALIKAQIQQYQRLDLKTFSKNCAIGLGALIKLEQPPFENTPNCLAITHWYFLGPNSGGMRIDLNQQVIRVITPEAPIAQQLIGKFVGDEIVLLGRQNGAAEIVQVS